MRLPRWLIFLSLVILLVILSEAIILVWLKPRTFPSSSGKKEQILTPTLATFTPTPAPKTITVLNQTKLATFRLADEKLFLFYLDKYNFWEKMAGIALLLGSTKVDNSLLVIELLDKQSPQERYLFNYQDNDGRIYQAAGVRISEGRLHLLLYLAPELLISEEKERLDRRINTQLLRLIYSLTHQEVKDLNDQVLKTVVAEFLTDEKKFVEIEK